MKYYPEDIEDLKQKFIIELRVVKKELQEFDPYRDEDSLYMKHELLQDLISDLSYLGYPKYPKINTLQELHDIIT